MYDEFHLFSYGNEIFTKRGCMSVYHSRRLYSINSIILEKPYNARTIGTFIYSKLCISSESEMEASYESTNLDSHAHSQVLLPLQNLAASVLFYS